MVFVLLKNGFFMAYKMQSEYLETKKYNICTYYRCPKILCLTPMSEACARGIDVDQLVQD